MAATRTKSIRRGQLVLSAQAAASFSAPLFRISTPLRSSKTISARLQGPIAIWVSGWTSNAREMSRWAASQFPDPQTRSSSFGIMRTATVKPCAQTTITLTAALNSTRPQRKQSRFTGISRSICLVSRPPGRRPGSRPELMQRPCPPGAEVRGRRLPARPRTSAARPLRPIRRTVSVRRSARLLAGTAPIAAGRRRKDHDRPRARLPPAGSDRHRGIDESGYAHRMGEGPAGALAVGLARSEYLPTISAMALGGYHRTWLQVPADRRRATSAGGLRGAPRRSVTPEIADEHGYIRAGKIGVFNEVEHRLALQRTLREGGTGRGVSLVTAA